MYRNRAVSLVLIGLFLWLTACTSYKQIEIGEVAEYGKVRVTLTEGQRETIREPRVESDTIRGREAVFALDQVASLEAVGVDEVGTVFTVLGIVVLTAVVTAVVVFCVADVEVMGETAGC